MLTLDSPAVLKDFFLTQVPQKIGIPHRSVSVFQLQDLATSNCERHGVLQMH